VGLVSQSPQTALNPSLTVGQQLDEMGRRHLGLGRREARGSTLTMLQRVDMPDPASVADRYPHQLSGGMCQRIMIAMALVTNPKLLIADEPTTGLDVSIAAQILDLLKEMGQRTGATILLITHDLGVVAGYCDRVAVMHAGQVVESASVKKLFRQPLHPYTIKLIHSVPRVDVDMVMETIPGNVPGLIHPPPGCRFADRCQWVMEICRKTRPPVQSLDGDHLVACYHIGNS